MKNSNKTNHTNVIPNSTSRGCKAEPYPFSASAVFRKHNKGIRKREQGNKFVTEDIKRHTEDDSPQYLQTQNHVITRNNIEQKGQKSTQSDVVIPNKLCNGETCKGLLRRFVHKITNNNEISPHNDMQKNILKQVQDDSVVVVQNNIKDKNRNELINLSTYRLIDFKKNVAFTLAEVLITLGIIGIVAAMTIPSLIETYQKKATAEKLKEMYSIITQAAKMYTNDTETEFGSFDTQLSEKEFLDKYFSPYVKVVLRCENTTDCYKGKKPLAIDRKTAMSKNTPPYMIGLLNGSYVGINRAAGGAVFYVDINGAAGPNVSGRDIFNFYLVNVDTLAENEGCQGALDTLKSDAKSGLYPGGYQNCYVPHAFSTREELLGTEVHRSCNKNTTNVSWNAGDACAAVIMMDGWKISKDYPW